MTTVDLDTNLATAGVADDIAWLIATGDRTIGDVADELGCTPDDLDAVIGRQVVAVLAATADTPTRRAHIWDRREAIQLTFESQS